MKSLAIAAVILASILFAAPAFATSNSVIIINGTYKHDSGNSYIIVHISNWSSQPIYKIKLDASTGFLSFKATDGWVVDKGWHGKEIMLKSTSSSKTIKHGQHKEFVIKASSLESTEKIIVKWDAWNRQKIQNGVFLVK